MNVIEPPNHIPYPSPAPVSVGMGLGPWIPTIAGTVENYATMRVLSRVVALDAKSGVIAGTPTAASRLTPNSITASSLPGNTRFIRLLNVAAPSSRGGH
jgi:hypothetical protein